MSMDNGSVDEPATVEVSAEEILDPEDYAQNQRLKDIYEARRAVRDALEDRELGRAPSHVHRADRHRVAEAVAFYGTELEPLMDKMDWSSEIDRLEPSMTVRAFIASMGAYPDRWDDGTPVPVSMLVFRRLNEFAHEAGLGAELDGDSDEWEI